jgi:hypothetical protein
LACDLVSFWLTIILAHATVATLSTDQTTPMRQHIAFLHTSAVHIETFEGLVRASYPALEVEHVLAEQLLAEAQRVGPANPSLTMQVQDAMKSAAASGAAIVVCTCSTIGGAAEKTPTNGQFIATRIDRAMADRAVQLGPRILLVAALESTLKPTAELIEDSASALKMKIALQHVLVPDAWSHFTKGNQQAYLKSIASTVRATHKGVDVVVLAQASMALAAERLQDLEVAVLSSPALGVQNLMAQLQQ